MSIFFHSLSQIYHTSVRCNGGTNCEVYGKAQCSLQLPYKSSTILKYKVTKI